MTTDALANPTAPVSLTEQIVAARARLNLTTYGQVAAFAAVVVLTFHGAALAQDVLGLTAVETAVIAIFKGVCGCAVCWGFGRMIFGRHSVEGILTMIIGIAGIAKSDTIVTMLGI